MGEQDAIEQESGIIIEVDEQHEPAGGTVEPAHHIDAADVASEAAATGQPMADANPSGNPSSDDVPPDDSPVQDESTTAILTGHVAAGHPASADPTEHSGSDDVTAEHAAADDASSRQEAAASQLEQGMGPEESDGSDPIAIDEPPVSAGDDLEVESLAASESATEIFEPPVRATAELKAILEALIFASPEPLSLKALTKLLDSEPKEDVATALVGLKEDYERPGGLQLVEVAGGYQIVTRHDLHEWVRRLFHERSTQKLSAQALETLAVVAYRQPITAVEITEIRGVNTSGVLNTLLERHLIKIVGRKAVVGRPFMYSTTKEFLIRFGLNDLTDLPRVQDMVDALGLEAPLLIEQAPLEDQLPLEEPDTESDDVMLAEDDAGLSSEDDAELGEPDEPEDPETRGGPKGSVQ